jgi:hypothetical protein
MFYLGKIIDPLVYLLAKYNTVSRYVQTFKKFYYVYWNSRSFQWRTYLDILDVYIDSGVQEIIFIRLALSTRLQEIERQELT